VCGHTKGPPLLSRRHTRGAPRTMRAWTLLTALLLAHAAPAARAEAAAAAGGGGTNGCPVVSVAANATAVTLSWPPVRRAPRRHLTRAARAQRTRAARHASH
jgi:hypothetical protein